MYRPGIETALNNGKVECDHNITRAQLYTNGMLFRLVSGYKYTFYLHFDIHQCINRFDSMCKIGHLNL